ncbi:hypothetical protein CesoFtcFv8_014051 [Champsocephalus esox]|uniref:Uncharacterized protein n=1 Tax=Champsocephalus esox TaxID=159716 RepID=A0AAN8BRU2_9TELE|nr:hypothetical protein CesoFtcFv8_014051 [Champsocephalus esox]
MFRSHSVVVYVNVVNLPSESSSSSSASFSRTSAGRVIATAGVGSNIIVSNPEEVLSAMRRRANRVLVLVSVSLQRRTDV